MSRNPNFRVMREVMTELKSAQETFITFASPHEGYAILLEEVDELWDDIKTESNIDHMRAEAIQVAAMAIRFVLDCCDDGEETLCEEEDNHLQRGEE